MNAFTYETAAEFWLAISNYADSLAGLAGEGNSGEFYDEREAARLANKLTGDIAQLIELFYKHTGYKPVKVYIDLKSGNTLMLGQDNWIFENFNILLVNMPEGFKITKIYDCNYKQIKLDLK